MTLFWETKHCSVKKWSIKVEHFSGGKKHNVQRPNQIRLYSERQPESRFRVMKVGRNVTVDDGGNYMSPFMS